ncbi:MAG: NAD(P)-binding protein, partial [Calditrichaeota bacterium]|nr:NAD(P)-binding protein [Calditrichota bacterium]
MSDKLYPLSLPRLLSWILEEEKSGQIFGIVRELFWKPRPEDPFRLERFGQVLETPIGVAAGPHTQMAQNIVSAWLMGARFIELKTVQTLDKLDVPKPCIDAEDEGYNVEWSQELRLDQSFNEYLNAWILLYILRHRFGRTDFDDPGFLFNMSVGYNFEGILQPNVQRFLSRMENCEEELAEKIDEIRPIYPQIDEIAIPGRISDNITLSTMHGCPPDEIEQIARYFIEERGLHTTVKLNPTLLGPEEVRELLNRRLGFPTEIPDEAFAHDLTYSEALQIIRNLQESAEKSGVHFGIKLSNTLESVNNRPVFPSSEKRMYLSGRALHPLTVRLASRLQSEFSGKLDISFSGGADAFNVADLVASGLAPVTVCTDLLKPGGFTRLPQYLDELSRAMQTVGASSIADFIQKRHGGAGKSVAQAALANLQQYAEKAAELPFYKKEFYPDKSIKSSRFLTPFDCIAAPCVEKCPAHQDVPEYMFFTEQGNPTAALDVVLKTNPFPMVTGLACDHLCQTKCTRLNYDEPLQIREIKRFVAEQAPKERIPNPAPWNGLRVVVIGAGPSGLSCAYFLRRAGCQVEIFEASPRPGGMAASAIPRFRLPDEALEIDVNRIQELGVTLHLNTPVDRPLFERLQHEFDFLYLSVGAQAGKPLRIPGEDLEGVQDALAFLSRVRKGEAASLGQRVLVIG